MIRTNVIHVIGTELFYSTIQRLIDTGLSNRIDENLASFYMLANEHVKIVQGYEIYTDGESITNYRSFQLLKDKRTSKLYLPKIDWKQGTLVDLLFVDSLTFEVKYHERFSDTLNLSPARKHYIFRQNRPLTLLIYASYLRDPGYLDTWIRYADFKVEKIEELKIRTEKYRESLKGLNVDWNDDRKVSGVVRSKNDMFEMKFEISNGELEIKINYEGPLDVESFKKLCKYDE